ncbi:MAG: CBS domain-containing protein [Candidatus Magasanikbacteria bacterium]|nr:CBS domain-containing protein [Candidatus Magasanikbacteria bacterium]
MLVKDVMYTDVVCLKNGMNFLEAAELFLQNKISGAPVLDSAGNLVGVLSEKDLFRALYPSYQSFYQNPTPFLNEKELEETAQDAKEKTIDQIMSRRVVTTTPNTHVLKVGGLMIASGIHRVPVMESGKIVGMVSRGTIYRAVLRYTFPEIKE